MFKNYDEYHISLPQDFYILQDKIFALDNNVFNSSLYKDTGVLYKVSDGIADFLIKNIADIKAKNGLNVFEYLIDKTNSVYYLGEIEYSVYYNSYIFGIIIGELSDKHINIKLFLVNVSDNQLLSVVRVSSYLYMSPDMWPVNDLTTTKLFDNGVFVCLFKLSGHIAPRKTYFNFLYFRMHKRNKYGSCARFRIHETKGTVEFVNSRRFWR